jgi:hypothetical protein
VLTIGGVALRLSCEPGLLGHYDAPYLPFLDCPGGVDASSSTMDIAVVQASAPANGSPPVFESGGAWMMQAEDSGYRLNFHREGSRLFHTVACCDAETSRVRVHSHEDEAGQELPGGEQPGPVRYPLDQLLLMNHLSPLGGVIVHAAGAVVRGKALVFAGCSGAGKSTLSRLLMDGGLGDSLLSDDRVILRSAPVARAVPEVPGSAKPATPGARAQAWGTPWPGDARVARNAAAPLGALLFLVKADVNELRPLATGDALRRLLPVVTCPWYDAERFPGVLDTCGRIVEQTACFELHFRPAGDVVDMLMSGSWTEGA